jgi:hypothetical protein
MSRGYSRGRGRSRSNSRRRARSDDDLDDDDVILDLGRGVARFEDDDGPIIEIEDPPPALGGFPYLAGVDHLAVGRARNQNPVYQARVRAAYADDDGPQRVRPGNQIPRLALPPPPSPDPEVPLGQLVPYSGPGSARSTRSRASSVRTARAPRRGGTPGSARSSVGTVGALQDRNNWELPPGFLEEQAELRALNAMGPAEQRRFLAARRRAMEGADRRAVSFREHAAGIPENDPAFEAAVYLYNSVDLEDLYLAYNQVLHRFAAINQNSSRNAMKLLRWVMANARSRIMGPARQEARVNALTAANLPPNLKRTQYGYKKGQAFPIGRFKARYGDLPATAKANQLIRRARDGFTGHGKYTTKKKKAAAPKRARSGAVRVQRGRYKGQGGFFGDLLGGIEGVGKELVGMGAYHGRMKCPCYPGCQKKGRYRGQGGFFGDLWGDVKTLAKPILQWAPFKKVVGGALASALKSGLAGQGLKGAGKAALQGAAQSALDVLPEIIGAGGYLASDNPYMYGGQGKYHTKKMKRSRSTSKKAPVKRIKGSGLYTSEAIVPKNLPGITLNNAIVNPGSSTSRNQIWMKTGTDEKGTCYVEYREFLTDVIPGTPDVDGFWTLPVVRVNPGLPQAFPLASILYGQYYSTYHFEQLVYEFVSIIGSSNTAVAGTMLMAPMYNVNDPPFGSKRGMERSNGIVTGGIQTNLRLGIECERKADLTTNRLIRTGELAQDFNLALYDTCNVQFATSGVPSTIGAIGEIWVHYRIVLNDLRVFSLQPFQLWDGFGLGFTTVDGINPPGIISLPSTNYLAGYPFGGFAPGPAGPFQLDLFPNGSSLALTAGFRPGMACIAPANPFQSLSLYDLNPACTSVTISATAGTPAASGSAVIALEMLAGQVFQLEYMCQLMQQATTTTWVTIAQPYNYPDLTVSKVGPCTISGIGNIAGSPNNSLEQVSILSAGTTNGIGLLTRQLRQIAATGNGGLVRLTLTGQNFTDNTNFPNSIIVSTSIRLTRTQ